MIAEFPQMGYERSEFVPVAGWVVPAARPAHRGAAKEPDPGLPITPGRPTHLVEESAFVSLRGCSIPLSQHRGVPHPCQSDHSANFRRGVSVTLIIEAPTLGLVTLFLRKIAGLLSCVHPC